MKQLKAKLSTILVALSLVAFMLGFVFAPKANKTLAEPQTPAFYIDAGAAINVDTTSNQNGLRWTAHITESFFNEKSALYEGYEAEFGIAITPVADKATEDGYLESLTIYYPYDGLEYNWYGDPAQITYAHRVYYDKLAEDLANQEGYDESKIDQDILNAYLLPLEAKPYLMFTKGEAGTPEYDRVVIWGTDELGGDNYDTARSLRAVALHKLLNGDYADNTAIENLLKGYIPGYEVLDASTIDSAGFVKYGTTDAILSVDADINVNSRVYVKALDITRNYNAEARTIAVSNISGEVGAVNTLRFLSREGKVALVNYSIVDASTEFALQINGKAYQEASFNLVGGNDATITLDFGDLGIVNPVITVNSGAEYLRAEGNTLVALEKGEASITIAYNGFETSLDVNVWPTPTPSETELRFSAYDGIFFNDTQAISLTEAIGAETPTYIQQASNGATLEIENGALKGFVATSKTGYEKDYINVFTNTTAFAYPVNAATLILDEITDLDYFQIHEEGDYTKLQHIHLQPGDYEFGGYYVLNNNLSADLGDGNFYVHDNNPNDRKHSFGSCGDTYFEATWATPYLYNKGLTGTFDGNGYVISDLAVTGGNEAGLFLLINGGTIKNVAFTNVRGFGNSGFLGHVALGNSTLSDIYIKAADGVGLAAYGATSFVSRIKSTTQVHNIVVDLGVRTGYNAGMSGTIFRYFGEYQEGNFSNIYLISNAPVNVQSAQYYVGEATTTAWKTKILADAMYVDGELNTNTVCNQYYNPWNINDKVSVDNLLTATEKNPVEASEIELLSYVKRYSSAAAIKADLSNNANVDGFGKFNNQVWTIREGVPQFINALVNEFRVYANGSPITGNAFAISTGSTGTSIQYGLTAGDRFHSNFNITATGNTIVNGDTVVFSEQDIGETVTVTIKLASFVKTLEYTIYPVPTQLESDYYFSSVDGAIFDSNFNLVTIDDLFESDVTISFATDKLGNMLTVDAQNDAITGIASGSEGFVQDTITVYSTDSQVIKFNVQVATLLIDESQDMAFFQLKEELPGSDNPDAAGLIGALSTTDFNWTGYYALVKDIDFEADGYKHTFLNEKKWVKTARTYNEDGSIKTDAVYSYYSFVNTFERLSESYKSDTLDLKKHGLRGTFDGLGHTISNFQMVMAEHSITNGNGNRATESIFGLVNGGTIKNLAITGAHTEWNYQGGLIANVIGNGATIENCYFHIESLGISNDAVSTSFRPFFGGVAECGTTTVRDTVFVNDENWTHTPWGVFLNFDYNTEQKNKDLFEKGYVVLDNFTNISGWGLSKSYDTPVYYFNVEANAYKENGGQDSKIWVDTEYVNGELASGVETKLYNRQSPNYNPIVSNLSAVVTAESNPTLFNAMVAAGKGVYTDETNTALYTYYQDWQLTKPFINYNYVIATGSQRFSTLAKMQQVYNSGKTSIYDGYNSEYWRVEDGLLKFGASNTYQVFANGEVIDNEISIYPGDAAEFTAKRGGLSTSVELISESENISIQGSTITALALGTAVLNIEHAGGTQQVNVAVIPKPEYLDTTYYFSSSEGLFYDKNFNVVSINDLFGQNVSVLGVEDSEGNELTYNVDNGTILGVKYSSTGYKQDNITIKTAERTLVVPVDVATLFINEATDLSFFTMKQAARDGSEGDHWMFAEGDYKFDGYYVLTQDIDASTYIHNWKGGFSFATNRYYMQTNVGYENPYCLRDKGLTGTLDGNGYTINNFKTINRLFGVISGGTMKNIGITNIDPVDSSGASVVTSGFLCDILGNSTFKNCYFQIKPGRPTQSIQNVLAYTVAENGHAKITFEDVYIEDTSAFTATTTYGLFQVYNTLPSTYFANNITCDNFIFISGHGLARPYYIRPSGYWAGPVAWDGTASEIYYDAGDGTAKKLTISQYGQMLMDGVNVNGSPRSATDTKIYSRQNWANTIDMANYKVDLDGDSVKEYTVPQFYHDSALTNPYVIPYNVARISGISRWDNIAKLKASYNSDSSIYNGFDSAYFSVQDGALKFGNSITVMVDDEVVEQTKVNVGNSITITASQTKLDGTTNNLDVTLKLDKAYSDYAQVNGNTLVAVDIGNVVVDVYVGSKFVNSINVDVLPPITTIENEYNLSAADGVIFDADKVAVDGANLMATLFEEENPNIISVYDDDDNEYTYDNGKILGAPSDSTDVVTYPLYIATETKIIKVTFNVATLFIDEATDLDYFRVKEVSTGVYDGTFEGYYELTQNISLVNYTILYTNGLAATTFTNENGLTGTFNGNGYTLFGGWFGSGYGLFGKVITGTVKNLAIKEFTVGGIVSPVFGDTISGATFTDVYVHTRSCDDPYVGSTTVFGRVHNANGRTTLTNVMIDGTKNYFVGTGNSGSVFTNDVSYDYTDFTNVYVVSSTPLIHKGYHPTNSANYLVSGPYGAIGKSQWSGFLLDAQTVDGVYTNATEATTNIIQNRQITSQTYELTADDITALTVTKTNINPSYFNAEGKYTYRLLNSTGIKRYSSLDTLKADAQANQAILDTWNSDIWTITDGVPTFAKADPSLTKHTPLASDIDVYVKDILVVDNGVATNEAVEVFTNEVVKFVVMVDGKAIPIHSVNWLSQGVNKTSNQTKVIKNTIAEPYATLALSDAALTELGSNKFGYRVQARGHNLLLFTNITLSAPPA